MKNGLVAFNMDVWDDGDDDDDLEHFSSPSRWMSGEAPFSFA